MTYKSVIAVGLAFGFVVLFSGTTSADPRNPYLVCKRWPPVPGHDLVIRRTVGTCPVGFIEVQQTNPLAITPPPTTPSGIPPVVGSPG